MKLLQPCLLLVCLIAADFRFFGQAPTGDIAGTVYDQSGAVVPSAPVTITNTQTGASRTFTTGGEGAFSGASLPAGTYQVRLEMPGFRTILRDAVVETGGTTRVDLHLEVGKAGDIVNVEAAAPLVEYDRHTIDGVVSRPQIQNLPLNGRSFLQLAFLQPGVTVSSNNLGQYNRQFDVSVLGGDSDLTRITVDGTHINDAVDGGTQQNFSQEVVEEFQVSTVNFDLSTGIAASGAINIVTRTGTNDFHGSGFFFFRDHNMAAYPSLERLALDPDPFFARRQTGGWFGGPIKKQKLFFFVSDEYTNQLGVFTFLPNAPEFQSLAGVYGSPYHQNLIDTRIDYHVSNKHTAFVRYSHDGNDSFAPRETNALPSAWVSNTNYADSGVFSLVSSFTPAVVNEFRYGLTYWNNQNTTPTASQCPGCLGLGGPYINVDGAGLILGNETNTPQSRLLRRHEFDDNLSWQKGSHRMKMGGEWEHVKGTGTYAIDQPAAINLFSPEEIRDEAPALSFLIPKSFTSLQSILRLPLQSFSFGIGDINQPPSFQRSDADHDDLFHFYWEDFWKIKPRFNLSYGLAWSYEGNALNHDLTKPEYLAPIFGANGLGHEEHAYLHFSPMLGFAWTVDKAAKTVVRGGGGIYYDTIDLEMRLIERAYLGPLGTGYLPLPGSIVGNPVPGISGVPTGTPLNFVTPTAFQGAYVYQLLPQIRAEASSELGVNPNNTDLSIRNINIFKSATDLFPQDYVPSHSQHASVGVQHQFTTDFAISADFVFRHFLHLPLRGIDLNHYTAANGPLIPACTGANAFDPAAECSNGPIQAIESGATSLYRGLLVKADKRFTHRYQMQVSYALQSQDGVNGVYNLNDWYQYRGPQLPMQVLNVSGIVELPWKFQASFISEYQSRSPFQPYIPGIDFYGSGASDFPLPGSGSNQFNISLGKSDLTRLVNQYNQTYAGKAGPIAGQVFPAVTLPANYEFGKNFNSQDLRVTKFFRWHERYELQIFGECFNLFNIANLGGYSNNLLDPNFGQPTTRASNIFGSGGPRAFQLGSRFSF